MHPVWPGFDPTVRFPCASFLVPPSSFLFFFPSSSICFIFDPRFDCLILWDSSCPFSEIPRLHMGPLTFFPIRLFPGAFSLWLILFLSLASLPQVHPRWIFTPLQPPSGEFGYIMLRVGSWLYGKKPANASTQSLDSLTELKDCRW